MENGHGSGTPTKIKIDSPTYKPAYRLMTITVLVLVMIFAGLIYVSSFSKSKKPLTEQEIKANLEAEVTKNPLDYVFLSGEWRLRSSLIESEWKTWENEQHEYARKFYSPDVIEASGEFFRVNDRYYESKRVFIFYDRSKYSDLPITRVEMTDNRYIHINCTPKDFAAMMQKTRR